ncbi:MAG: lysophospholipase [Planctomycetota bacterium]|nr:lysophospholipase [Planctomycetota bacterium]MDA1158478.1 lysophospholipase [Planctomycetota bacterium]
MKCTEFNVTANDSANLFVRSCTARPADRCGRTLVIIHGTSEHGGRYLHAAEAAVSRGWDVLIPDLRGHGRSDGIAVHIDRFDQYLQDLDTIWQYFELNPSRTAVLGHSFGGLVSIRFAETRASRLAALVPLSPLLGLRVKIDPLTYAIGRMMSVIAPTTRFQSKVPPEHTTRNAKALAKRASDPLLHRSVTASWFFQMKQALQDAHKDAPAIVIPVLAMQAGADLIVDPLAVEPWLEKTGSSDRTLKILDEHYHELLNEEDWQETLNELLNWLDSRIKCGAASVDRTAK